MTATEFLDWDGGGHQGKLELVDGSARALSPASGTHALIQATLALLIGNHLRAHRNACRVGTETPVRPRMKPEHNVRAPDLAVTYLPRTSNEKFFPDPVLIVEVLSPSHQRETWESIWAGATIPTVVEVPVVDSERIFGEVFRRDENGAWRETSDKIEGGGTVRLTSIDATFALAEIYAETHLGQI